MPWISYLFIYLFIYLLTFWADIDFIFKKGIHDSMDGTREHYAKSNKPGSERQIPYDLTYKWNLINTTTK